LSSIEGRVAVEYFDMDPEVQKGKVKKIFFVFLKIFWKKIFLKISKKIFSIKF